MKFNMRVAKQNSFMFQMDADIAKVKGETLTLS